LPISGNSFTFQFIGTAFGSTNTWQLINGGTSFMNLENVFIQGNSYGAKCFQIGSSNYIAIGYYSNTLGMNITIYTWATGDTWINSGATGVVLVNDLVPNSIKVFNAITLGVSNMYMVVAESGVSQASPSVSRVFQFVNSSISPTPVTTFPSVIATEAEAFMVDSITYLLLSVKTGTVPSLFYRWNSNLNTFDQISTIINPFPNSLGITTVKSALIGNLRYIFAGCQGPNSLSSVFQLI